MTSKEQLLYFFLNGKISLSQYDYKFMSNLTMMISKNGRVTSNQAELFDNLVSKYQKQLTKQGYSKEALKALPWKTDVVESSTLYTGATVKIMNDEIVIRVPFNKNFIAAFRNIKDNHFDWVKDEKIYRGPFSTASFKIVANELSKYFSVVNYCDESSAILNDLKKFSDAKIWNPTLVDVNGNLILAATNPTISELLGDRKLSRDPKFLMELTHMGIIIDKTVTNSDPLLEFASSRVSDLEITNLEEGIKWMSLLGCTHLIIGRGLRNQFNINSITATVEKYGIEPIVPATYGNVVVPDKTARGTVMMMQHVSNSGVRYPITNVVSSDTAISKIVVIKDSRPIEVR